MSTAGPRSPAGSSILGVAALLLPHGRPGEHLVGGDGDGADVLAIARVLAHLILGERRLVEDLADPLSGRRDVGGDDERVRSGGRHRGEPDDGLARTAGQHEHAVAGGVDAVLPPGADRVGLVAAQVAREVGVGEDAALGVAGLVGDRPAELEQRLLERATVAEADGEAVAVEPFAEHLADVLVAGDLDEERDLVADEGEPAGVEVAHEPQPAVAAHLVVHLGEHAARHRVLGEIVERGGDLAGVHAGDGGVPQRQRRDAVGVDVLGRLLELAEALQGGAGVGGARAGELEHHREIALHDERVGGVGHQPTTTVDRVGRWSTVCVHS